MDVYLLSGSLKDNDTARGGKAATVKIEARSVPGSNPFRYRFCFCERFRFCNRFRGGYPLRFGICFGCC